MPWLLHGAIEVSGLARTGHLDALRAFRSGLAWPATRAAVRALVTGMPALAIDEARYDGTGADVLTL